MKTLPKTDWITHKSAIAIDGIEYEVEANVFLESKEVPDPWSYPPREEKVTASVEGWSSLPPVEHESHKHYWKLDSLIRQAVEEEYNT